MKTKQSIGAQLASYKKEYERTKDSEAFKINADTIISDLEEIVPVTPFFSSEIFRVKLDWENLDRSTIFQLIESLETLLEKLP